MSEFKNKVEVDPNEVDAAEMVAEAQKEERKRILEGVDPRSDSAPWSERADTIKANTDNQGRWRTLGPKGGKGPDGMMELLETMKRASEEAEKQQKKILRQQAWDSISLGGLCALGVVSLIAAAITNVWLPVAVGLGVCLSGGAGVLVYRGLVVLRK